MRRDHKVTKDIFAPPKDFAPIRVAAMQKQIMKSAERPSFLKWMGMSPSQPHSKMFGR